MMARLQYLLTLKIKNSYIMFFKYVLLKKLKRTSTLYTLFLSILFLLLLSGCKTDNIQAGVKGTLKYGEGNCSLDQSFWYYNLYSGYVFLIEESVKDTISVNYNSLHLYSDSTFCNNGKFLISLNPGNYYLFLKEYPIFGDDQKVTVFYNQLSEKEFFIYRCI
jgi:hypothetical protein